MSWKAYRPVALVIALMASVLALTDFRSRIYVGLERSTRAFKASSARVLPAPLERNEVFRDLARWIGDDPASKPKEREIVLQGVFYVGGVPRAALSLLAADSRVPERLKVAVGEEVEGWKVESIEARRMLIRRGNEVKEFILFKRR